jgi:hypothetical protein
MTGACVIECKGRAVGLVVQDRGRYRFHASDPVVLQLEHRIFRSPADATRAAMRVLAGGAKSAG